MTHAQVLVRNECDRSLGVGLHCRINFVMNKLVVQLGCVDDRDDCRFIFELV